MRIPLEWLKDFVAVGKKPEELASALTMSGVEVEAIDKTAQGVVFELGLTPNRSDCMSISGAAREVAAVLGVKQRPVKAKVVKGKLRMKDFVTVQVKARRDCPRYSARAIADVKVGPSPKWLADRLAACGVRSINNVVDATNYVMLETGQPLHAFDAKFISGKKIVVRSAGQETAFKTLDGAERKLLPEDLLICDESGPVALAGIMGGENSEVRGDTTRLILESAYFSPTRVRKTSKRLGLASESSRRFEKGIDPNGTVDALTRLAEVILETAGGEATADHIDIYPEKIRPRKVAISAAETNRILGTELSSATIAKLLSRLGLKVQKGKVEVPTCRPDLEREIDLIEEVARLHGYSKIRETMPMVLTRPIARPRSITLEDKARSALVEFGFSEALSYGFADASKMSVFAKAFGEPVSVVNPLSAQQGAMVTTLIPNLLDAARLNINKQYGDVKFFSIQNVFPRSELSGKRERRHIAGVVSGKRCPGAWEDAKAEADFYDAKAAVQRAVGAVAPSHTPGFDAEGAYDFMDQSRFASVTVKGKKVGFVGAISKEILKMFDIDGDIFAFEVDLCAIPEAKGVVKYAEPSKYPFVERDFAFIVGDDVPAAKIEADIAKSGGSIVKGVRIFDVYRGKGIAQGRKSIALSVRFQSGERTLSEDEVLNVQGRILDGLKKEFGAELRT